MDGEKKKRGEAGGQQGGLTRYCIIGQLDTLSTYCLTLILHSAYEV